MHLLKKVYNTMWECYYKVLYLATRKQLKQMQELCDKQYEMLIALKTTIELLKTK